MGKYSDPHAIDRRWVSPGPLPSLSCDCFASSPTMLAASSNSPATCSFPTRSCALPPNASKRTARAKPAYALWNLGRLAGLPLITIGEARDISLVRQMLQAHTYWRMHGLTADPGDPQRGAGGYEQPLRERLESLIQTHSTYTGKDQPGEFSCAVRIKFRGRPDPTHGRGECGAGGGPRTLLQGVPVEVPELSEPMGKKRAPGSLRLHCPLWTCRTSTAWAVLPGWA